MESNNKLRTLWNKHRALLIQIFRFGIVGGTAFIVEMVSMWLIRELVLPQLAFLNLGDTTQVLLASATAFIISLIYNYVLSVVWVFEQRKDTSKQQVFAIFLVLNLIALGLNTLFMYLLYDLAGINEYVSKVVATLLVMIYNFISRKIFIEDHSK